MQIDRLFGIVNMLLNKNNITAKQLADHFEVSTRTIYRDIDALSLAGIPVYSSKGYGGGIGILKEYTIDKAILTKMEQNEVIHGLQILSAVQMPNASGVLDKLSSLFRQVDVPDWIEVDFSPWGSNSGNKTMFNDIERAVHQKIVVAFDYYNTELKNSYRYVEPFKLIFKGQAWYLKGCIHSSGEMRTFKLSRIRNFTMTDEVFTREISPETDINLDFSDMSDLKPFKLKFKASIAYRVYDEFPMEMIEICDDGSFIVNMSYPINEWLISYILSFSTYVEILEPYYARELIKKKIKELYEIYK